MFDFGFRDGLTTSLEGKLPGSLSSTLNVESVTQSIAANTVETVNVVDVNGYQLGMVAVVDRESNALLESGITTNANNNLNGIQIENTSGSPLSVTVRFYGLPE